MAAALRTTPALPAATVRASKRRIETTVDIAADPAVVWAVLTDGAAYGEWNPFIVKLSGRIEPGARIAATMQPAGGRAMTFRPHVLVARACRELRWRGRFVLPGLFTGEHYFLLAAHGGGTRLVHGERFSGLLLAVLDTRRFRADFEAMNGGLKRRAEALQAGGGLADR